MKIVNIVKIENIEKAVLACVLTTRNKILSNYLEVSELLFPVHVRNIISTRTKKFSYV